jgi:xylulokinase
MLGAGALAPGQGTVKLASVGRIAFIMPNAVRHKQVLNYPYLIDGLWYPGTATKYAASAYRWFHEAFWAHMPDNSYEAMDRAASNLRLGADELLFLLHLMGQLASQWDPKLSGAFLGVGVQHHIGHFTRAVLEGVALALRDAFEEVNALGLDAEELFLIGAGAQSPIWAQIVSDVLGRKVSIPKERDAAYGAVLLAGMATGRFPRDAESLREFSQIESERAPDSENVHVYSGIFEIYRMANQAIRAVSKHLYDRRLSTLEGLFSHVKKTE